MYNDAGFIKRKKEGECMDNEENKRGKNAENMPFRFGCRSARHTALVIYSRLSTGECSPVSGLGRNICSDRSAYPIGCVPVWVCAVFRICDPYR